jgi:branched-chain amino acid transport system ATP-binding protein
MQLNIKNLKVSYGNIKALHGIDFTVEAGEILTIIGANGAGKSTTLRAISRMVPSDPGSVLEFEGKNILKYSADKVVSSLGISHVPEGRRIFGNLTVTILDKPPALPGRLPKFDIYGNKQKSPIM